MIAIARPGDAVSELTWTAPALSAERVWRTLGAAFGSGRTDTAKLLVDGVPSGGSPDPALAPLAWARTYGGRPLLAYARAVQRHDRALFEALVVLLAPVLARDGLPGGPVEAEVFCGDYRSTPGGVHRETCSNVHLVVAGAKSMHFWLEPGWPPHGTVTHTAVAPESGGREDYLPEVDPARLIAGARTLTADAGRGFAWRAGAWHVGETHGPSLALNVAAYERAGRLPLWADRLCGEVPADWLAACRRHTGSDAPLARSSGLGMCPAPPSRRPSVVPDVVRFRPSVPVLWCVDHGVLTVAAMGAATHVPDPAAAHDWLARALGSPAVEVPGPVTELAGWLIRQGALEPVEDR